MATLTVRNIDDALKEKLRVRAARHGQSMEAEIRSILRAAIASDAANASRKPLALRIHERFAALGGVDLELPPRSGGGRSLPDFD